LQLFESKPLTATNNFASETDPKDPNGSLSMFMVKTKFGREMTSDMIHFSCPMQPGTLVEKKKDESEFM